MGQVSSQREKPGLMLRMIQWLAPRITPLYLRLYRLVVGRRRIGFAHHCHRASQWPAAHGNRGLSATPRRGDRGR